MTLELRPLNPDDEDHARAAHAELADDGFPFLPFFDAAERWDEYLARIAHLSRGEALPQGLVPWTDLYGVVDGVVVGRVSVRHRLTDSLARVGGHISCGVRPAHRRRGHATALLRAGLGVAHELGIDPALVTCGVDNVGSAAVIESCSGVTRRSCSPCDHCRTAPLIAMLEVAATRLTTTDTVVALVRLGGARPPPRQPSGARGHGRSSASTPTAQLNPTDGGRGGSGRRPPHVDSSHPSWWAGAVPRRSRPRHCGLWGGPTATRRGKSNLADMTEVTRAETQASSLPSWPVAPVSPSWTSRALRCSRSWCTMLGYDRLGVEDGEIEIGPAGGFGGPAPTLVYFPSPEPKRGKQRLRLDVSPTQFCLLRSQVRPG